MKINLDNTELENIGLDSINIECYRVNRNRIANIYTNLKDLFDWAEPDSSIINLYIKITGNISEDIDYNEIDNSILNENGEIDIGRLKCNYIEDDNPFLMNYTFYDKCDSYGGDLEPMASAIIDRYGNIKSYISKDGIYSNILYIDKLIIEEKYRNTKIGSFILQNLTSILYYTNNIYTPCCQIVLPQPLKRDADGGYSNMENENTEYYMKKLIKFYKKNGFKKIRNTRYMYKY